MYVSQTKADPALCERLLLKRIFESAETPRPTPQGSLRGLWLNHVHHLKSRKRVCICSTEVTENHRELVGTAQTTEE